MNVLLESLARDRQMLVDRSALCRLRLRRDAHALRRSLELRRASVAVAVVTAPAARALAWSLALSFLGAGRVARMLALAGRVVLVARLAGAAVEYARGPSRGASPP